MRRANLAGRFVAIVALLGVAVGSPAGIAGASSPAAPAADSSIAGSAAATPGSWTATGTMAHARGFAPAVLLADGSVITAGGTDAFSYTASAERWTAGTWAAAGSIGQAVAGQVAVRLPNGKALFAGGADAFSYYGFGDLFNPAGSGSWTQTPAMAHAHAYGVAASLANGDVLVIGGYDGGDTLTTGAVDIYSASGGTWSAGPALPGPRYAFTATTMGNGKVLVAGGDDGSMAPGSALSSVEIYTSGSGWAAGEAMKKVRVDGAAVLLKDGRVLVAGGTDAAGVAQNSAEIYDPSTGHWTLTGNMPLPRAAFSLTVLPDGRVVAAGGFASSPGQALNTADLFDPTTGGWTTTGVLVHGRRFQAATALADGTVMVVGGHSATLDTYLAYAEIYTPPPARVSYPATTFHPVDPIRLLDSRVANGFSGVLFPHVPRRFQVSGRGGVPTGAVAVTGILTTTLSTAAGYLTIGPVFTATPTSSTLNFPAKDNRANNVAVALDANGMLALVYVGAGTTHAVFDLTGYFTADNSGATFMPLTPGRVLDSRNGTGVTGKFATNVPRPFQVRGQANVPPEAIAVTGNFTVVGQTTAGWAFVGPSIGTDPATYNSSTVNAPTGDTRADGVTVKLASDGTLSAVWSGRAGSTTDLLFDVTGYFVNGTTGSKFVPLEPIRLVDTRYNLPFQGPIHRAVPATLTIAGHGDLPSNASGISGNLTVTVQTALGYITVAPLLDPGVAPSISTINFPKGDNRANGFYVALNSDGTMAVVYEASISSATTHFIIDISGYFLPAP
jgi:hypothetical protein